MRLRAFAKINLDLRILGRRPDGYHEVRTVLQSIDWCDEIHMQPAREFSFTWRGGPPGIAQDETNLVVRAVREFEKRSGEPVRLQMELVKNIPAGAGLGGGSADAAVTLLGLQRLCSKPLPDVELQQCLRALGSDVPFFALGGRALGTGRGDEIQAQQDDSNYWLLVVHSGVHISTAEAYSWLTVPAQSNTIKGFGSLAEPARAGAEPGNDFEGAVFRRHPELEEIRDALLVAGAGQAMLSGSGSAVFGRFARRNEAESAQARLRRYGTVRLARPLPRAEYLRSVFRDGEDAG